MTKTLIKKQLSELFSNYVLDRKTGKARSRKGVIIFAALAVLLFLGLGFAFFAFAGGVGASILGYGANWLYFALMGLVSIALGVFGSVFNTYASLYLPKDNEFLLSLPIPERTILFARATGVYAISLMYSAWVWIPVMIAYWMIVPAVSVLGVVFPILLTFVIALFVSVLSCLLGWIVALVASKAKGKSFLTVLLSLFVMVAYYVIYFKVINSMNEIMQHLDGLGTTVKSWLHYVYILGQAADGSTLHMLLVTAVTLVLAAVCFLILSRSFTRIALSSNTAVQHRAKAESYAQIPVKKALVRREFKHFASVSTWMLNGGLGLLIMPALAVFGLIKADLIREIVAENAASLPQIILALPVFLIALLGVLISMNVILPVSISLEGNTMWIIQTLPVESWEILRAKERMSVMLNIGPAAVSAILLCVVFRFSLPQTLLVLFAAVLYVLLTADFGLYLNLKRYDLTWTNITTVIKGSPAVFIYMFGGWIFSVLIALGGLYLCGKTGIYAALAAIVVLLCALWCILHRWLKTKGVRILDTM